MSYTQPQPGEDQHMHMYPEGSCLSHYTGVPDTYFPSVMSNCPLGTDQIETMWQLPEEFDPQYAQQLHEGSSGYQYPLHIQGQTFFDGNITAQADMSWPEPGQVWLQQAGYDFNPFGETVFSDDPGYPELDNDVLSNQTANRERPVDKEAVGVLQKTRPILAKVIERRKPHSAAVKQQIRDSALRSNQWAKAYTVKLVMEAEFQDSDGKLVDHLVMPATRDIATFLKCSNTTVRAALRKTDDKKGVVLGVWKVEECERTSPAEVEASDALHKEISQYEQEIDMEPMSLLLSFINSSSCQSVAHWETSNKPGPSTTHALSQTSLLEDVSVWQNSQPLLSMEDVARNDMAAVMQSVDNAMDHHKNPVNMPCVNSSHSIQVQDHHSTPLQATETGQNLPPSHKKNKKMLTRGPVVNVYHVSQKHGETFNLEGKLVSSAVIMTTKSVATLTGASYRILNQAKLHVHIEWDAWRITYLGRMRSGDDINQEILARLDTIPGFTAGAKSLLDESSISGGKEAMLQNRTHNIPTGAGTVLQRYQYRRSEISRVRNSLHAGNAKLFRIERKNGTSFKYGDRLVDCVKIRTRSAAAEFLNCSVPTIQRSLKAKGKRKGIVKDVWKVTDLGVDPGGYQGNDLGMFNRHDQQT
ncbi:hypothetical protein FFLO_06314 [Filobasidium floriforme]|uniref:Uncharacterized protein n=1 Tax=Filobasidium floriforme TaxID=5210 RepID=A0A8K0JGH9_9TREE|nr:hypothetical protein FFLO_06314 [Filobasidium floriforme]